MKAIIASGSGRYADPWHPFPDTSRAIAGVLRRDGFDVSVDDDVDHAMAALEGVDLLVVNAGDPWRGERSSLRTPQVAIDGFATALQRGIGVIAMHSAVASLRDYPEWAPAVGGMWVPRLSFHPEASHTTIAGQRFPDGPEVAGFELFDERYCRLQPIGRSTVVATHEGADPADPREPSAWVRSTGAARVAVDVLGHDERSYEAEGHRRLIVQLARWVTHRS